MRPGAPSTVASRPIAPKGDGLQPNGDVASVRKGKVHRIPIPLDCSHLGIWTRTRLASDTGRRRDTSNSMVSSQLQLSSFIQVRRISGLVGGGAGLIANHYLFSKQTLFLAEIPFLTGQNVESVVLNSHSAGFSRRSRMTDFVQNFSSCCCRSLAHLSKPRILQISVISQSPHSNKNWAVGGHRF